MLMKLEFIMKIMGTTEKKKKKTEFLSDEIKMMYVLAHLVANIENGLEDVEFRVKTGGKHM